MICSWMQRDYGIDVIVEITKSISNSIDQIITGKRFSIQLKSSATKDFGDTKITLSVPKEKISYWYEAIEPVLLVYVDLKSKRCFFKWIDEGIIEELFRKNRNWIVQKTVTIEFDVNNYIDPKRLLEIEKYVIHWKRPAKTILSPGNYFKYSAEARSYIDLFHETLQKFDIPFLQKETEELRKDIYQTTYTIAVVGPSRAGKSTLINCLLQREISPVGILPTTGIPITIFPKDENKAVVLFKNNKELIGTVDSEFLKEYTSQEKNPGNRKEVKLVSIHIINTLLEKGIALCDVPGLDDPDNEIRAITKTALYNVNAIIYVINAASMRDGGFSITKQIIDELAEMGGRMDKLFLVFNKIDVLNDEQIAQLENYVNSILDKYSISQYLPTPPIYISSKNSFENRIQNNISSDSVGLLEKQIWEFLLSNNKTGLHRLLGRYGDFETLIGRFKKIINARLLDADKRVKAEIEINNIKNEITEIKKFVSEKRKTIYSNIKGYLNNSFINLLTYLQKDLQNIPLENALPANSVISSWLENNAYQVISYTHSNLQQNINELQSEINNWISLRLNQVELTLESNNSAVKFSMPEIVRYTSQINNHLLDKNSGVIGILESLLWGVGSIIAHVFVAVENILTSDIKLRQKSIQGIVLKSKKCYSKIITDFLSNLNSHLDEVCMNMEEKAIDRTKVYLGELSNQLNKLDIQISSKEKANFEAFINDVSQIENAIESNFTHLKDYTNGIGWLEEN